ncbi:MAG TPA: ATP-binding protein, partial [Holophagaceae bacterium]
MHLPLESPALPYLAQIEQATLRAADLTRQLLAYAGKGRLQVADVDLNRLVTEMTQLLTVSISKKAVVRYDLAPDLPRISGDPSQMQQLVMNLVTNASEAIGEEVSGLITVRTGLQTVDESTHAGLVPTLPIPSGRYVTLEVSDTGCGMTPEVRERIFDPFFTTKFTGRGLGLSAMLGILRSHHGSLKVYSEVGRGSVFKLFLPAQGVGEEEGPAFPSEGVWQGRGVLLLVDDEPSARAVARGLAQAYGFQVLEAADGQEALGLFELRHRELAVVLMDLTMPHLDGRQTFLRMHAIDPSVPVVLTSGYSEEDVVADFLGRGLAGFLPKPYQRDQFLGVLKQALSLRQQQA